MPRTTALALLLGASLLASSATTAAAAASNCEVDAVPKGAVFGVRKGSDIATFPPKMPRGGTGCQRVWHGKRAQPAAMQVLATYYYEKGVVRRLVGRVPGGASYTCLYRDGILDKAQSQNVGQCPAASAARPGS